MNENPRIEFATVPVHVCHEGIIKDTFHIEAVGEYEDDGTWTWQATPGVWKSKVVDRADKWVVELPIGCYEGHIDIIDGVLIIESSRGGDVFTGRPTVQPCTVKPAYLPEMPNTVAELMAGWKRMFTPKGQR